MLRVSEHYVSVQGEGPNTGEPIQFLRFGGCNMRCPGWPCDTPQAIFPEQYRHEWKPNDVHTTLDMIHDWPRHVCITGGEPFLQGDDLLELIERLTHERGYRIDIFTNGSFEIPLWVRENWRVFIVMDWKLQGSGEAQTRIDQRWENAKHLPMYQNIKFVVKDKADLDEARELTALWKPERDPQPVSAALWVGAAWGCIDDATIVEYVQEHQLPWRLNIQTHKHVWDPEARYT